MILITGGARSGKSSFAENMALGCKALYIATAVATDEEMLSRIQIHKNSRPKTWDTHEGYLNLSQIISSIGDDYEFILLECITTLITNLLFHYGGFDVDEIDFNDVEHIIHREIDNIISACQGINTKVILITNEIGLGIVPADKLSRNFRDIQGRVNQKLASCCDQVYMLVSGLPIKLK